MLGIVMITLAGAAVISGMGFISMRTGRKGGVSESGSSVAERPSQPKAITAEQLAGGPPDFSQVVSAAQNEALSEGRKNNFATAGSSPR